MADLFIKHWPTGPEWDQGAGRQEFILEMDEYELSNLRWLMDLLWTNKDGRFNSLQTGDWLGQIRHSLIDGTSRLPFELRPNVVEPLK